MLVQKVKLTVVGEPVAYPKRENGMIAKDANGNDVIAGYRRQLVFESQDYRKDSIPITLFNDEAKGFGFSVGNVGELQFQIEMRESKNQEGETRLYTEFRLINFSPTN
ncbi:MAG: hypothetical protein IKX25_01755 [Bacteroidales bacterium]|nr:hypothetical protein [Bacteroidales bacterium]